MEKNTNSFVTQIVQNSIQTKCKCCCSGFKQFNDFRPKDNDNWCDFNEKYKSSKQKFQATNNRLHVWNQLAWTIERRSRRRRKRAKKKELIVFFSLRYRLCLTNVLAKCLVVTLVVYDFYVVYVISLSRASFKKKKEKQMKKKQNQNNNNSRRVTSKQIIQLTHTHTQCCACSHFFAPVISLITILFHRNHTYTKCWRHLQQIKSIGISEWNDIDVNCARDKSWWDKRLLDLKLGTNPKRKQKSENLFEKKKKQNEREKCFNTSNESKKPL